MFGKFPLVGATEPPSASRVPKTRVAKKSSESGVVEVKLNSDVKALNIPLMNIQMSSNLLHPFVSFIARRVLKYAKSPNVKFYANKNKNAYVLFGLQNLSEKRATLEPLFVSMMKNRKVLRVSKTREQPRDVKNMHLNFGSFEIEGCIKEILQGIFSGNVAIAGVPEFTSSSSSGGSLPIVKFRDDKSDGERLRRVFVLSLKHRTVSHGVIKETEWKDVRDRANRDPRPVKSSNHDFVKERTKSRQHCTCSYCRDNSGSGLKIDMLASEQEFIGIFEGTGADVAKNCLASLRREWDKNSSSVLAAAFCSESGDIVVRDRSGGSTENTNLAKVGATENHAEMRLLKCISKDEHKDKVWNVIVSTVPCPSCSRTFEQSVLDKKVNIGSITFCDASFVNPSGFEHFTKTFETPCYHIMYSVFKTNFDPEGSMEPVEIKNLGYFRGAKSLAGLVPSLIDWSEISKQSCNVLRVGMESKMIVESRSHHRTDLFLTKRQVARMKSESKRSLCFGIHPTYGSPDVLLNSLGFRPSNIDTTLKKAKERSRIIFIRSIVSRYVSPSPHSSHNSTRNSHVVSHIMLS